MVKESFELWTASLVLITATQEGRWRTQKVFDIWSVHGLRPLIPISSLCQTHLLSFNEMK